MNDRTRAALERAAVIKERRERNGSSSPVVKEVDKEKEASEETLLNSVYKVGEEVMAMWSEDRLHYKARVDRVCPGERYDITFLEYGNEQSDTHESWILTVAQVEELASKRVPEVEEIDTVEIDVVEVDPEHEEAGEDEKKELEETVQKKKTIVDDDEKWELTDNIPLPPTVDPSGKQTLKTSKQVGTDAEGRPIYMSAEEEAQLRLAKKQDKKERKADRKEKVEKTKKGLFSKLKKDPSTGASSPSVVPETTTWSKTTESSRTPPIVPPPPSGAKLSPRRAPPAPPKPSEKGSVASADEEAEDLLEPLPSITPPTKVDDPRLCGHLFIVRGDLRRLQCDAWLVPTGREFTPDQQWFLESSVRPRNYTGVGASGLKYFGTQSRVTRAPGWPDPHRPHPYLVAVSNSGDLTPINQFLELATAELHDLKPENQRLKHLLALPMIGKDTATIDALLPALMSHARNRNVDIVLVVKDQTLYNAVHNARRTLAGSFATLDSRLSSKATELAQLAQADKLALFYGPGLAALSSWKDLLSKSMAKVSESDREDIIAQMHPSDVARFVRDYLGDKFSGVVAKHMSSVAYSISHAMLASLPFKAVATTNIDALFEMASEDVGKTCSILPYAPMMNPDRLILKLNGSVAHNDPLPQLSNHSAGRFEGIVQSCMASRHIYFCGFSFADGEFMRVSDQVRTALRQASNTPFGTVSFPLHNDTISKLWPDLNVVPMILEKRDGDDIRLAVYVQELFLDYLSARTTQ